jgi:hypothetical protein
MSNAVKNGIDLFFICYFIILGIIIALKLALSVFSKKQYTSTVKKAALIRATLHWCVQHLGYPPGRRQLPELEISYYKHQKMHGFFNFNTRRIKIYPNNHDSVTSIINTVIHEYIHFLEVTNKETRGQYSKFHQETGYDNNPFEVSARKKAEEHTPHCVTYLLRKGILT